MLAVVARRVRSLRALRGVSRKMLAEYSGVSVRHLAQIEQGLGNVSIRLLQQIAAALGVSPAELLAEPPTQEQALLANMVASLSPAEYAQVEGLIRQRLRQPARPGARSISLVGLRGAGKSTLGQALAEALEVPFVSITQMIEDAAGMHVAEINALSGQAGYRRYEQQAVAAAMQGPVAVIEAGGSVVANTRAYADLLAQSFVVWVKASPAEHMARVIAQGDLRPMEGRRDAMDDLVAMLEERSSLYAQAHAVLDTSGCAIDASVTAIKAIAGLRTAAA